MEIASEKGKGIH